MPLKHLLENNLIEVFLRYSDLLSGIMAQLYVFEN